MRLEVVGQGLRCLSRRVKEGHCGEGEFGKGQGKGIGQEGFCSQTARGLGPGWECLSLRPAELERRLCLWLAGEGWLRGLAFH